MADKNFSVKNGLTVANNLLVAENGKVSINSAITPVVSLDINSTDGIKIPVGNTGQRPSGNSLQIGGVLRYNTDIGSAEIYSGSDWSNVGGGGGSNVAVGGSNTEIQFNDSTALGASANLRFDKDTSTFTIGNSTVNAAINSSSFNISSAFSINSIGYMRLGATNSPYILSTVINNDANSIFIGTHSNTDGSTLRLHRTRASYAAQTVPQASDNLASFAFAGFTPGTSVKDVASIRVRATETFTNDAHGSEIIFATSNTGGNTVTDRLIVSANASVTVNGALIATANIGVGSNVVIDTTRLFIGNSTVNTVVNSSYVLVGGKNSVNSSGIYAGSNVSLDTDGSRLVVGNSTVNATVNSTAFALNGVAIGGNTFTGISVGNSTVNGTINSTSIEFPSGYLRVGGDEFRTIVNGSSFWTGNTSINAIMNSTLLRIGNTTVNATVNSTAFALNGVAIGGNTFTGIFVGNSTANIIANASYINMTGTVGNVYIYPDGFLQLHNATGYLRVGNSTVNATVNSSGIYSGNVSLTRSLISIGNSTVNATVNSIGIYSGNVSLTGSLISIGNSTVNATVNSTAFALNGVAIGGGTGKQSIYIPASSMISPIANGAQDIVYEMGTTNNAFGVLRFDASTRKNAQFSIAMPKSWDEGTITFKYFWTANTTSTPGVTFGVEAVAVSDTDNINVAFGTAQHVSDTFQSNNKLHASAESSAITIGGTPAEQDMVWFKVFRDVANTNDTMSANADLIGIMVYYTTNAGNDA